MSLLDGLKDFAGKLNSKGVPLPMVRDPRTGVGSVSLSMVVVSFGVDVLGLIGKAANLLGNVDLTQGLYLLGISCSLYFGRQFQKTAQGQITLDKGGSDGGSTGA